MTIQRMLLLGKTRLFWSLTSVLLVGLIVGLLVWDLDPDTDQLLAAASLHDSSVRIESVHCLAIDPHKVVFDEKDYWDPQLAAAIVDILSIKSVLFDADYATCPLGFFGHRRTKTGTCRTI